MSRFVDMEGEMRIAPWELEILEQGDQAVVRHLESVHNAGGAAYCIRDAMRFQLSALELIATAGNEERHQTLLEVVASCSGITMRLARSAIQMTYEPLGKGAKA